MKVCYKLSEPRRKGTRSARWVWEGGGVDDTTLQSERGGREGED